MTIQSFERNEHFSRTWDMLFLRLPHGGLAIVRDLLASLDALAEAGYVRPGETVQHALRRIVAEFKSTGALPTVPVETTP